MGIPNFNDVKAPTGVFIDGSYRDAIKGAVFENINPATGEKLCTIARGRAEDIDGAVLAARRAFDGGDWVRMSPSDRERILYRIADELETHAETLAALETYDTGKPYRDALSIDVRLSIKVFRYYAGWPTKLRGEVVPVDGNFLTYTLREPVGVVGQIIPWNFPLFLAAMKLGPALAAGNTVVLKPAEEAPLTPLFLGNLLNEAGVPKGVVNIVPGFGEEAGAALVVHPLVDKLAFTGSTEIGRKIMAQAAISMKRVSLELGGKSPNVIFADADLPKAMRSIGAAIFYNQGEVCAAGSRLFVEDKIYDQALEAASTAASKMKIGDPFAKDTRVGALISAAHRQRVHGYVQSGVAQGAKLIVGGSEAGINGKGFFYTPTVLANVSNSMKVAQEEIFGPVLGVIAFKDIDELIAQANDTQYGLAAGVWTRDIAKAHTAARALKAGSVYINTYGLLDPAAPFGGYKMSGIGREMGAQSMDMYTECKTVWTSLD